MIRQSRNFTKFLCLATILVLTHACTWNKEEVVFKESGYPKEVDAIITAKCSISGCHNDKSKGAAAGLALETWDHLFEGSRGGAVVIPFRSDFSTLFYYVNTDSTLGLTLLPTMPIGRPALSRSEVLTLRDWIDQGAPDKNGFVKFSDNPARKKFYVANQGCDVVTVFDAASMLAMRCVNVGNSAAIESPHMLKVSEDNQFWHTVFLTGHYFQTYSVAENALVSEVNIGSGNWNTFSLSSDGKSAYVIDFSGGTIAIVDLPNATAQTIFGFTNPHGSALNPNNDTLYIVKQTQSGLYKLDVANLTGFDEIDLVQSFPASQELRPHEIAFSPDGTKYFVTCQSTNEVRVVSAANDSVIAAIPVGIFPQEMAFSLTHPYLFVSCMEDVGSNPDQVGSIAIINYQTNTFVKKLYAGYQSHGIAVDDANNRAYISNRNVSFLGPAPHHSSICGGRNGNVTAIDLNTLELVPDFQAEVSVDPYGIGIMH
ncbi:MAG: hypothetical protein KA239_12495 [Bacteroidia bacterium]|nr:hypothetical protein [Bacteroidia bacterium]